MDRASKHRRASSLCARGTPVRPPRYIDSFLRRLYGDDRVCLCNCLTFDVGAVFFEEKKNVGGTDRANRRAEIKRAGADESLSLTPSNLFREVPSVWKVIRFPCAR